MFPNILVMSEFGRTFIYRGGTLYGVSGHGRPNQLLEVRDRFASRTFDDQLPGPPHGVDALYGEHDSAQQYRSEIPYLERSNAAQHVQSSPESQYQGQTIVGQDQLDATQSPVAGGDQADQE